MAWHNETGKIGEELAAEYLIKKGYVVRDMNWRWLKYELDIVCEYQGRIVVVEVKTRTSDMVDPLEAITPKKIAHIVKAADVYLKLFDLPHEVQFDVVTLTRHGEEYVINHIEDAFFAPLKTYR
ncbi:MAG TPA: YraN family protein [Candidatus Avimuribaculum pullicola]|nr:YraN family protein [Candidatus Avimuribaculum pullicola]